MPLALFLGGLHLVVIASLIRGAEGGVALLVVVLSAVPVALALRFLLSRFTGPLTLLDWCVLAYVVWSLASGLLFLQAGNPSAAAAFAYGAYNFVLPVACYFAVKAVRPRERHRLLTTLVVLDVVVAVYGLYLHFGRPAYYVAWVSRVLAPAGALEEWQVFARLQSYLGSTLVGYLATTGIVLASIAGPWSRRMMPALTLLFTATALLSLQRASLVALLVSLGYVLFAVREHRGMRAVTLLGLAAALVFLGARLGESANPIRERVLERATTDVVEGLQRFFDERGYRPALGYLRDFPLGVGLGGTSSAADNAGLLLGPEVADANFMRVAADLGWPGLLLFLLLLAVAFGRAWRGQHRSAWITYLVIHCGIMLSTNVLDSFYVSHAFWLVLALLDSERMAPGRERVEALPPPDRPGGIAEPEFASLPLR